MTRGFATFVELYALSRWFSASSKASSSVTEQAKDASVEESELRLAQLQHQLPSNEPGALMHLIEDAGNEEDEDDDTRECKKLFKNMTFFLSREVRLISART